MYHIDEYGNTITSVTIAGDHWRLRHDNVKHVIDHLCFWSYLTVTCEVMNMFVTVIKEKDKIKEQTSRQRQGMVPDFYFQGSGSLVDVKCMT